MLNKQSGLSLVELMVSITIGLFLLAGLTTLFVNASRSQAELLKSSQQIENGRYAIDLLSVDLHHAGYYGDFNYLPPLIGAPIVYPALLPDACDLDLPDMLAALPIHVQGFNDPPAASAVVACLPDANHVPRTDILVVRRAHTEVLLETGGYAGIAATPTATATPVLNEVYLQTDSNSADIQPGAGAAIDKTKKANNTPSTISRKDYSITPSGFAAGYLRKYHLHIYFVAPCSVPNGGGTTCTGAGDDNGRPIPTLKRLELTSDGTNTLFRIVPLVEGIENLQVEYGVDTDPAATNAVTGVPGDGAPDNAYLTAPTLADWGNVVTAKVFVLARNTERSAGYTDNKSYQLGTAAVPVTPGGNFKRHLYSAEVRLVNPSSRREIPR
jgi:type IV pilus assembly protein PilW